MEASRQPAGIPAGGQFAPTAHAEPDVRIGAGPSTQELATRVRAQAAAFLDQERYLGSQLEIIRERQDRMAGGLAAAAILEQFPEAATVTTNRDRYGLLEVTALHDSAGNALEIPEKSVWTRSANPQQAALGAAVLALNRRSRPEKYRDAETAEIIDLHKALGNAMDNRVTDRIDPHTEPLTAEDRRILVDAAKGGYDNLTERLSYPGEDRDALRTQQAELMVLLGYDDRNQV